MNKKKLFIILGCAVCAVAAVVLIIVLTGKDSAQDTSSAASGEVSTIEAGTAATTLPADPSQDDTGSTDPEAAGSENASSDGSSEAGSSSSDNASGGTTSGTTSGAGGIETPDDVFDDPVSSTPAAVDEPSDTPSSSSADMPSSSAEQPPVDEPITLPYSGEPIVLPTIKLN